MDGGVAQNNDKSTEMLQCIVVYKNTVVSSSVNKYNFESETVHAYCIASCVAKGEYSSPSNQIKSNLIKAEGPCTTAIVVHDTYMYTKYNTIKY